MFVSKILPPLHLKKKVMSVQNVYEENVDVLT